jgi:hypothetical protein
MENEVIILVISHKEILNDKEQISLLQLYRILGKYPIKFICPQGLNISNYLKILPNADIDFIDAWWQSSYENFNKLKIEPFLYKRYKKYQYILFYEPDAFVFKDELQQWCEQGYDYIGAPWFVDFESKKSQNFLGVGNGGFSLRKTSSLLDIWKFTNFFKIRKTIKELYNELVVKNGKQKFHKKIRNFIYFLLKIIGIKNNPIHFKKEYIKKHEDLFWGLFIPKYFPNYKVATVTEAIPFSFEFNPSLMYSLNDYKLPFGCHAWWKYDLGFWKPFVESYGYEIGESEKEENCEKQ